MDANPELDLKHLQALNGVINRHAIVSITDVTGRITYVNDKFCEISILRLFFPAAATGQRSRHGTGGGGQGDGDRQLTNYRDFVS